MVPGTTATPASYDWREFLYQPAGLDARVSATAGIPANGVSIERFTNAQGVAFENIISPAKSGFAVAFVGNLRPWHGVEILIDAFAEFSKIHENSKLLIVGEGNPLKEGLHKRCNLLGICDKVKFTGAVPFEEIPLLLEKVDVAVAPYPDLVDFYFSPLKLLEYMAAGKSIVASRIGQVAQILTHEKNALLVPPGDSHALALALSTLYQSPAMAKSLGLKARSEACLNHTWKQRVSEIIDIFQSLNVNAGGQS